MKILLFSTNTNNSNCPPIGLYLMKAYVEERIAEDKVDIKVLSFRSFNLLELLKFIIKNKPDVLGIGCYVWNISSVIPLCEMLKKRFPEMKVILGGPSISFNDKELTGMLQNGYVDFMIMGEGERAFYDVINGIINNDMGSILSIPGLMGKDADNKVYKNKLSANYKVNLDSLPNPYLLYNELQEEARQNGVVYMETSRGCPYNCMYCVSAQVEFSYKSMDIILNELKALNMLGLKNITVLDSTLNFNTMRTKQLLKKIIDEKWELSFTFEIKAECLDDELISLFWDCGLKFAEIGLQSSNENTLRIIKRYHDADKFSTNIRKLLKIGLNIVVDLIIGLPGESIKDWYNSLDYCYRLGNIKISSMVLKVFPNTLLSEVADNYGYKFDPLQMNKIVNSNTMSLQEINLAERISYIINAFWSCENNDYLVNYIRDACDQRYSGKFSLFFADLTDFIYRNKLSHNIMNDVLENKRRILDQFLMQCSSGYNSGGKLDVEVARCAEDLQ